jgi:hypothetical protein
MVERWEGLSPLPLQGGRGGGRGGDLLEVRGEDVEDGDLDVLRRVGVRHAPSPLVPLFQEREERRWLPYSFLDIRPLRLLC